MPEPIDATRFVRQRVQRDPVHEPPVRITDPSAIVHDWFQGYHGAERVVDAIRADVFALGREPDVFTFHAARELLPPALASSIVKESRLARVPAIRQRRHDPGRWRNLLPSCRTTFGTFPSTDTTSS